jgi:hypothetical protein
MSRRLFLPRLKANLLEVSKKLQLKFVLLRDLLRDLDHNVGLLWVLIALLLVSAVDERLDNAFDFFLVKLDLALEVGD